MANDKNKPIREHKKGSPEKLIPNSKPSPPSKDNPAIRIPTKPPKK